MSTDRSPYTAASTPGDGVYVRHFFHVTTHEPRDRWTHTVTDGAERGLEFEFSWVPFSTDREFALALDDYVPRLAQRLRG